MTDAQLTKRNLKIKIAQNKNAISLLEAKKQERLEYITELETQLEEMEAQK